MSIIYSDCSGCEHKAKCLYKYNAERDQDKNKVMKISDGSIGELKKYEPKNDENAA